MSHQFKGRTFGGIQPLKLTAILPLKMDGWNTSFHLGWPIFRGELLGSRYLFQTIILGIHVSFRECTLPETNIFAPENVWLEYDCFLLGFGLFSDAKMLVSGSRVFSEGYRGKLRKVLVVNGVNTWITRW